MPLLTKRKAKSKSARRPIRPTGSLRHLATRIFNTPLLIDSRKLESILAVLGPRLGLQNGLLPVTGMDFFDDDDDDMPEMPEGDDAGEPPCTVIPVYGTLVKRSTGMDALSGLTSYDALRYEISECMDDPNCQSIVLDFDSPGGEVSGMFDLVDYIKSVKGQKPIVGIADDDAYSAAYAIASCCDKLLVTSVGGVGSIGCYMLHLDQSGWDKNEGLKFTYIYSGDTKVDGNPHEALSDRAQGELQADVNRIRQMFVDLVAANRGVDAKAIFDTQARTYMGIDGIPLLADGVGTIEDAVALAMNMASVNRSLWVGPIGAIAKLAADGRLLASGGAITGGTVVGDAIDQPEVFIPLRADSATVHAAMASLREKRADVDRAALLTTFSVCGWADIPYAKKGKSHPETLLSIRSFGSAKMSKSEDGIDRITGVLAPYNSLSADLGGFREIYEPGCFADGLKEPDDLWILSHHNPEHVLGCRSANTAKFWEEADGLHYECNLPNTQVARDLIVSMQRGDVHESSAAFFITGHRWEQRATGRVRIVEKAKLLEGSPCIFAAYKESTASISEPETAAAEVAVDQVAAIEEAPTVELYEARLRLLNLS